MKNTPNKIFLGTVIAVSACLIFTACNIDSQQGSTNQPHTLTIVPPPPAASLSTEEKKAMQDKLQAAADKHDYEAFGDVLKQVYAAGLGTEKDFQTIESKLYVEGTKDFDEGRIDVALNMANTIFGKVTQSWRFKYLKIECLQKLGTNAYNKNDLATAQDYATQIMRIEFRPEGVNLMAKVNIKQAQQKIDQGKPADAKQILTMALDMDMDAALRKQMEDMLKKL